MRFGPHDIQARSAHTSPQPHQQHSSPNYKFCTNFIHCKLQMLRIGNNEATDVCSLAQYRFPYCLHGQPQLSKKQSTVKVTESIQLSLGSKFGCGAWLSEIVHCYWMVISNKNGQDTVEQCKGQVTTSLRGYSYQRGRRSGGGGVIVWLYGDYYPIIRIFQYYNW